MNYKLGFVHLPRTAGTAIGSFIKEYLGNDVKNFIHTPISELKNRQDIFLFGFIRNPFDWYVSRYEYYINKDKIGRNIIEKGVSKANDAGLFGDAFKKEFKTLKDHLIYGRELERFWLSDLCKHMFFVKDKLDLDYVGKVETINKDMNYLCKRFDLKPTKTFGQFCKKNPDMMNKSVHGDYMSYYDNEMIELVKEKDKEIFEKWYI